MRICKDKHGWTVKDEKGAVKLKNEKRKPIYLKSRAEVKQICTLNNVYERASDGVLVELVVLEK